MTNGNPQRGLIVEGVRLSHHDAPYFTKSHAYEGIKRDISRDNRSDSAKDINERREGVVVYCTTAGDLAFLHLSDPAKSSVLLLTDDWQFTTQSLVDYNSQGDGVAVANNVRPKSSTGWWPSSNILRGNIFGMKRFEFNVHDDFGGEVVLVELRWPTEANERLDVLSPPGVEASWYPIVAGTRNLGLVISISPENFGHPLAAFSLPQTGWPFSEYYLNSYYIAGVVGSTRQFAFLRYARDSMETVCSLRGKRAGKSKLWSLPEYLPQIVTIDLRKMGLSNYEGTYRLMLASNLDIHIQPDRAGELVFVMTGAGVTAFDVSSMSQYGGLNAVKSYWWRHNGEMKIFVPGEKELDREEQEGIGSWRAGAWAYQGGLADRGYGKKSIAPCAPRIWKSFLLDKIHGGGEGDGEMFTIVRAYNYVVHQHDSVRGTVRDVPQWQRPEFLVTWEIPLTRKGLERHTAEMLNEKAGIRQDDVPSWDVGLKADGYSENAEGIFPSKIMELHVALTENPPSVMKCFASHVVLISDMPQMSFAKRDTHKTRPRWLSITQKDIMVEKDEYRTIAGPAGRNRWGVKRRGDGYLEIQLKDEQRDTITIDWDSQLKCERPYPRTLEKRRSGVMSFFGGGTVKVPLEAQIEDCEKLPTGSMHHIKVGDSGNYVAYVVNPPSATDPDGSKFKLFGNRRGGTLVVVRYD
ncbi:hypothetical protein ABW20_dc0106452 [Dactylellina cionopaga]|nr:hypothetical protein ABW20_dc0106452 [Dactylellina cionopaga]